MLQEISKFTFLHGLLTFNKFNTKRKQILVLLLVTVLLKQLILIIILRDLHMYIKKKS